MNDEVPADREAAQAELEQVEACFQKAQIDMVNAQQRHAYLRGYLAATEGT